MRPCHVKDETGLIDGFYGLEGKPADIHDVFSCFEFGLNNKGRDGPCLSARTMRAAQGTKSGYQERKDGSVDRFEYTSLTYGATYDASVQFGRGLISRLGLKEADKLAIFCPNRVEWVVALLAASSQSMTIVPLYPTLGPDAVEFILMETESNTMLVSLENLAKMAKTIEKVPALQSSLKHIVVVDCCFDGLFGNVNEKIPEGAAAEWLNKWDIQLHGMSEIIAAGVESAETVPINIPKSRDSLALLLYTSGTTGNPKGVCLTQNNLVSCAGCVSAIVILKPESKVFLYLPLMHVFSVILATIGLSFGSSLVFPQGDIKRLVEDMQASKPTLLPSVPRVFVKFFSTVFQNIDNLPFYKRWYIYSAYNYQLNQLRQGLPLDPSYDNAVFSAIREKLGLSDIEIIVLGGGATPNRIFEFMRVVTNAWVVSGYGSTECSGGAAITLQHDYTVGSIGSPIGCLEYRLASVPDLNYNYTDEYPAGELLLSGHTVAKGYYKNPEATAEAFVKDSDGRVWLRTGDIARLNTGNMSISIIDRKKALVKNALGEYLSIEKLVNQYSTSPHVAQVFCYANSFKATVVAVIAPNAMNLYKLAVDNKWWSIDETPVPGALTPAVNAEFGRISDTYQKELVEWIKPTLPTCEAGLLSFEKIKAFYVDAHFQDVLGQTFSEANGLLTPTMKLKQQMAIKAYVEQLQKLYESIGEPDAPGDSYW